MAARRSMMARSGKPILSAAAAVTLTACGANLIGVGGGSVTGYEASSLFAPTGHSVASLPDGRIRVTATGSAATPAARVEKIAMARAAEYGAESGQKFFRTDPPQQTIRCGKRERIEKGEKIKIPPKGYTVVEVDVTYANAVTDATFRPTKDTAESLKSELAAEAGQGDPQTEASVMAQCGGA